MDRYNSLARTLHWILAILILFNLVLGFAHEALPKDWKVMPVHKSVGLTVMALTIGRVLWRFTRKAPPLPAAMPAWEKGAAHATHFAFYAFMLVMPLTGWIMSSAGSRPLNWFFLFDVPKFAVSKGDAIVGISGETHEILAFVWAALIVVHVLAALRHHFILKDSVLRRMI
ncbi:cytochrome b [Sphingobium estronivorans]|uniref:cytochrome b n=1 Tax=Sphingobium estronivorans TaxID=1577690 RepID=UPI00123C6682|nr:cytochrome b [Sphingobium estronivorans]